MNSQNQTENQEIVLSQDRHFFDPELASQIGIPEAIVLQHLIHWIQVNKRKKINLHEGKTWTYQTFEEMSAYFPYFSPDQIRDILYKLEHGKGRKSNKQLFKPIIITGNYNKNSFDRTPWYAFINEDVFIKISQPQNDMGKSPNGLGETPSCYKDIDIKTDIKTKEDIKENSPTQKIYIEREKEVKTTDEEHENLSKDLTEEVRDECYKILSEWKITTPRSKWKKDDNLSIRRWVIDKYKENKEKGKFLNPVLENKILAENISNKYFQDLHNKKVKVIVLPTQIEFQNLINLDQKVIINYSDCKFKENIEKFLNKLGIKI